LSASTLFNWRFITLALLLSDFLLNLGLVVFHFYNLLLLLLGLLLLFAPLFFIFGRTVG
jgi:hypothetical protein